MRVFEHPNLSNPEWRCPICQTRNDKPVVLIGISGTKKGNNMQAEQFHLDCINLYYYPDMDMLAMRWF